MIVFSGDSCLPLFFQKRNNMDNTKTVRQIRVRTRHIVVVGLSLIAIAVSALAVVVTQ
jgi:hypothetical protein